MGLGPRSLVGGLFASCSDVHWWCSCASSVPLEMVRCVSLTPKRSVCRRSAVWSQPSAMLFFRTSVTIFLTRERHGVLVLITRELVSSALVSGLCSSNPPLQLGATGVANHGTPWLNRCAESWHSSVMQTRFRLLRTATRKLEVRALAVQAAQRQEASQHSSSRTSRMGAAVPMHPLGHALRAAASRWTSPRFCSVTFFL